MSERVKFWVSRDQIYGVLDSSSLFCFVFSPQIKGGEHLRKTDTGRSVLQYNINITYEEEDVSFTE